MKITNKLGLELAFQRAVEMDEYDSGANISISQLTSSPRSYWLKKNHADELVADVSDRIWLIMGKAVHYILEKYAPTEHLTEHRLFADINGWKLSGAPDVLTPTMIQDWKNTSVFTVLFDANKRDYVYQLNGYRYLAHVNKLPVPDILENVLILRDWSRRKASIDKSYPQGQVEKVRQEVIPLDQMCEYIYGRVSLFQQFDGSDDAKLPLCTPEERWYKGDKYAVMKKGRKTAIKICLSPEEAELYIRDKYKGAEYYEKRPTENVKCEHYCECREFCDYYKEVISRQSDSNETEE